MGYTDKTLKKASGSPIPQFWDPALDDFREWAGDANGPKVQDAVALAKLNDILTQLQTLTGYVDGLEGKDYATQATLAQALTQLQTLVAQTDGVEGGIGTPNDAAAAAGGTGSLTAQTRRLTTDLSTALTRLGDTTDAAVDAGAAGSVSAKLRRLTQDLDTAATRLQSILTALTDGSLKATLNGSKTKTTPVGAVIATNGQTWLNIGSLCSPGYESVRAAVCAGESLYAIFGRGLLYRSDDNGETWVAETSVNGDGAVPATRDLFLLDVATDGTILVYGIKSTKVSVWRRPVGAADFTRVDIADRANLERPASASSGKLGSFMCTYVPASTADQRVVWRSQDSGLTWSSYSFDPAVLKNHVHCVWASPWDSAVYVSGGDDSVGGLAGVYKSADFANWSQIYRELPGERIVPITGNQRRRYFGVEHTSGGVLATYDDATYEKAFSRSTLGWANFECLKALPNGLLVLGLYAYENYDGQKGQGGELWVSDDDGASYERIRLPYSQVSCIAYNDRFLFVGFGYSGAGWSTHYPSQYILRMPLPTPGQLQRLNRANKIVINTTSEVPAWVIPAGTATHTVDMSPYDNIGVLAISNGACTLTVQGIAHERVVGEVRDKDWWQDLATITFTGAGEKQLVELTAGKQLFSIYRVMNKEVSGANMRHIAFLGSGVRN